VTRPACRILVLTSGDAESLRGEPVPKLLPVECLPLLLPAHSEAPRSIDDLDADARNVMLNCVRTGVVAGRERMLVAGQDGYVRVFELPTRALAAASAARAGEPVSIFEEARICSALGPLRSLCARVLGVRWAMTHLRPRAGDLPPAAPWSEPRARAARLRRRRDAHRAGGP